MATCLPNVVACLSNWPTDQLFVCWHCLIVGTKRGIQISCPIVTTNSSEGKTISIRNEGICKHSWETKHWDFQGLGALNFCIPYLVMYSLVNKGALVSKALCMLSLLYIWHCLSNFHISNLITIETNQTYHNEQEFFKLVWCLAKW